MNHRAIPWMAAALVAVVLARAGGAQGESPASPHPLEAVVEQLAQRYRARVVLDHEVPARAQPLPGARMALPAALDQLCGRLPGTAWRRVYLPKQAGTELPKPERLGALARAFDRIAPASFGVERPAGAGLARFERTPAAAATEEAQLRAWGLEPEPLYLIYSTTSTSDGRSAEARMADLQRQQLALAIPEEQLGLSKMQVVSLMQRLPKADMERLATNTVAASFRVWDATPPEQRDAMMQRTMRQMERFQPSPAQGGNPRAAKPGGQQTPNRLPELVRLARGVAPDARLLVDPTLLILEAPKRPAPELSVPRALDALVQPLSGVGWRRLWAPKPAKETPDTPRIAAAWGEALRSLEAVELPALAFQDAATGTTTRYRLWPAREQELPAARDPRWDEAPAYVLFNTITGGEGRSMEERLSNLQWQQFQTMFRMTPEQLTRSMEDAFHSYEGASPAMQERLLALPLISGMMAGWFPWQAKERGRAGQ